MVLAVILAKKTTAYGFKQAVVKQDTQSNRHRGFQHRSTPA
jgi:hypothetical protein